jgi:protein SCO1/2
VAVIVAALAMSAPAWGHHPGQQLDEVMGDKEHYFQAMDVAAPAFTLTDPAGEPVRLADFSDKVVVLHFVYTRCPDVCPLHADKVAEVQSMVNQTPMQGLVQFLTVTTDPEHDTPGVIASYGTDHGLAASNWMFLTTGEGQAEDATRQLARAYGLEFTATEDGLQMHGTVTFVIDRDGRLAAKFHGLRFESTNMVLYLNGLTNAASAPTEPAEPTWWDWLKSLVR